MHYLWSRHISEQLYSFCFFLWLHCSVMRYLFPDQDQTHGPRHWSEASLPSDVPGQVWFSMTVPAFLLCIFRVLISLLCSSSSFHQDFIYYANQSLLHLFIYFSISPALENPKDYVVVFSKIWSDYSVSECNEFQPLKRMKCHLQLYGWT